MLDSLLQFNKCVWKNCTNETIWDYLKVGNGYVYLIHTILYSTLFFFIENWFFSSSLKKWQRYKKAIKSSLFLTSSANKEGTAALIPLEEHFPWNSLSALIPAVTFPSISRSSNSAQVAPHWGMPNCVIVTGSEEHGSCWCDYFVQSDYWVLKLIT